MSIPTANKSDSGKRIYDKLQYCLFCGSVQHKLATHLQHKHGDEADVIEINKLKIEIAEERKKRLILFEKLRHRGNFHRNMKILKIGGELVVWRRPAYGSVVNVSDYTPCPNCFAFVCKSEMWRHVHNCVAKNDNNQTSALRRSELLLHPNKYSHGATEELKALILNGMNKGRYQYCGNYR